MRRCAAGLVALYVALNCGVGRAAEPKLGVDWRAGVVRVLGVGTPRILSPTGSVLERDALELARESAFDGLRRVFRGLPRPAGGASPGPDPLAAAGDRAPGLAVFSDPTFFSDGTVHIVAEVALMPALGHGVPPATTRVFRLRAPAGFAPCAQLRVQTPDATVRAVGLPGDAPAWLRYVGPGSTAPTAATSPTACTLALGGAWPAPPPELIEVELP